MEIIQQENQKENVVVISLDQIDCFVDKVADMLTEKLSYIDKDVLNIQEASDYLSLEKSYMYELVHNHKIACHHSRGGKLLYFKRSDLDAWALGNRTPSLDEVYEGMKKRASRKAVGM